MGEYLIEIEINPQGFVLISCVILVLSIGVYAFLKRK
ncbi:MAG: hypothetical protein ACI85I_000269 [Arenicella sp.]|jgi:hypothetical protein